MRNQKEKNRQCSEEVKPSSGCIVIGYHYPCLDGIYSALNCFLSLKVYSQFHDDLLNRFIQEDLYQSYFENTSKSTCLDSNSADNSSKKQQTIELEETKEDKSISDPIPAVIEEEKKDIELETLKQRLQLNSEDLKGFLQTDSFKLTRFVASKIVQNPTNCANSFLRFSSQFDLSKSVLILLDYYGQTGEAIKSLCQEFARVIIIDHHKTLEIHLQAIVDDFEKEPVKNIENISNVPIENEQLSTTPKIPEIEVEQPPQQQPESSLEVNSNPTAENNASQAITTTTIKTISPQIIQSLGKILPNLVVIYNSRMSGASLTLDFFRTVFQVDAYLHPSVIEQQNQITKLVEIYDTKFISDERAEAFSANIITQKYELNVVKNPCILGKLLSTSIEGNIIQGKKILASRAKQVAALVKNKFIVNIGGKTQPLARCYAVLSNDRSLVNDVAHRLAELSFEDKMDNVGCFVYNDKLHKNVKVSLRADNSEKKEQKCHLIAMHFNGGGHPSASSFFTTFNSFKNWRQ